MKSFSFLQSASRLCFVACTSVLLLKCGALYSQEPTTPNLEERQFVAGINAFAFDLYRQLAAEAGHDSNLVFSPFSIAAALSETGAGARGETAAEIMRALHLADQPDLLRAALPQVIKLTEQRSGADTSSVIIIGNGLFVGNGEPLRPDYYDWFVNTCLGRFQNVEFAESSGRKQAIVDINRWVSDKTHGRIKGIVSDQDINPLTVAVIANTLFFDGKWKSHFTMGATKDRVFYTLTGDSIRVPTMESEDWNRTYRLFDSPDFQMIELPYRGDRFAMLILLPRAHDGLPTLESSLDMLAWNSWRAQLAQTATYFVFRMPKLKLSDHKYIMKHLQSLGVNKVFDSREADLTGMFTQRCCWVDKAIHGANVDVDEWGTVASAATVIAMVKGLPPKDIPRIYVDHPYLFAIVDNQTGAILLMCRVVNPLKS